MQEIYHYINLYVWSKLHGKEVDINRRRKALDAVCDMILLDLKEINQNIDIDPIVNINDEFVVNLAGIVVAVETSENRISYKNNRWTVKGKINNSQEYIDCILNTILRINTQITYHLEKFNNSGEFILLSENLYLCFSEYLRWYNLQHDDMFDICESIVKKKIDDSLFQFHTVAQYILPCLNSYYCPVDELPPIQFETIDGNVCRTYCVGREPTEFALVCDCDRNKLYFCTMIVNIFEAAKVTYLSRRNISE